MKLPKLVLYAAGGFVTLAAISTLRRPKIAGGCQSHARGGGDSQPAVQSDRDILVV